VSAIATKSNILDASGQRAESSRHWRVPSDKSGFFGWMGADGYSTIRVSEISAMFPEVTRDTPHSAPTVTGNYIVFMGPQSRMVMNAEDSIRLMRRLGWYDPESPQ
jgi:hypothetical protein